MRFLRYIPLVLLWTSLIHAADLPLTWDQAVSETSRNNPDLTSARQNLRGARYDSRAAWGPFFPTVSAEADLQRAGSDFGTAFNDNDTSAAAGVRASQNLFNGLADQAQLRKERADLALAAATLRATSSDVHFTLKRSFYGLLYIQEQVGLSEAIAQRRKENLRLVNLRYEGGREHKGSALRSQAAYSQALYEEAQSRRSVRVAQRQLASTLGRDPFDSPVVTGEFAASVSTAAPDFKSLTLQTPRVVAADARVAGARALVAVARGAYFPNLTASAAMFERGDENRLNRESWSGSLSASLPFSLSGQPVWDARRSRASFEAERANAAATFNSVATELEDAFASYQNALELAQVQQEFLAAAEVRAEIARSQYTSGLLTFQDWDQIENDLISAQKAALVSRRDALFAEAAWESAQGKGSIQ